MTWAFSAILALLIILAVYAVYAYYVYHRVYPAERGCVDCTSPAQVNGFELYYLEVGTEHDSPPVILVHGGPGHSSLSFKSSFDFLAAQTRVIYYDQRGSGNSHVKSDPKLYTVEQLVEELEALRRNIVKADKIILIGHSFGSALVQRYAIKYLEHVEKMVIVGGIRVNNGMSSRFFWKWFGPAIYSIALGLPPSKAATADAWFTRSSEKDNPARLFDKSNATLLADTGTLSFIPWREISLSLVGSDFKTELSRLQTPTLFIYGKADSQFTGKPVADYLSNTLLNCQSVGFDQSGHWPFLEEPEKFQQTILDFLKKDK
jgi:proline iminopeptidase